MYPLLRDSRNLGHIERETEDIALEQKMWQCGSLLKVTIGPCRGRILRDGRYHLVVQGLKTLGWSTGWDEAR